MIDSDHLKTAIFAVKEGGKIALDYFGKEIEATDKGKGKTQIDWVTDADINAEKKIIEIIKKNFPNYNIDAEETGFQNKGSDYTWFIDPVSCTKNFVRGLPHFGTVLGLAFKDEPILGVVLDPYYKELYFAEKDKGAWFSDRKLKVSDISDIKKAFGVLELTRNNISQDEIDRFESTYKKIRDNVLATRFWGSNALHMAALASGKIDFFVNNLLDPRSHCAGAALVKEAGGKITDIQGNEWTTKSKNAVFTNGQIHQKILDFIR